LGAALPYFWIYQEGSRSRSNTMYRKVSSLFFATVLAISLGAGVSASTQADRKHSSSSSVNQKVEVPLNLAVLIQDDVVSQVGNELGVTREFIRSLPAGSQVMVGYITTGTLQVRQPFTTDLDAASRSLRIPIANGSASPYNPYIEVIEALKKFDGTSKNKNAILLVSDGLDVSRGFDITTDAHTLDLERAIKEAQRRNVAVFSFYAPTVGLTSRSFRAAAYGQSSLNRLSHDTGGEAFFQGTTGFVTFNPYFDQLRRSLNDRYSRAG
jgi:hypothetical protein